MVIFIIFKIRKTNIYFQMSITFRTTEWQIKPKKDVFKRGYGLRGVLEHDPRRGSTLLDDRNDLSHSRAQHAEHRGVVAQNVRIKHHQLLQHSDFATRHERRSHGFHLEFASRSIWFILWRRRRLYSLWSIWIWSAIIRWWGSRRK